MKIKYVLFSIIGLIALPFIYFAFCLFSSIPAFKDDKIPELSGSVSVSLDSFGVPTIKAASLLDAIRAQGYMVARDRGFQVELMRRKMSGRLSEVFGSAALEADMSSRFFNFSKIAKEAYDKMEPKSRAPLEAYAEGMNAWFSKNRSFETKLLGIRPSPWHPSDSLLIILSMFQTLERWENDEELSFNLLKRLYPDPVVLFLHQDYGFLDAVPFKEPLPVPLTPPVEALFNIRGSAKSTHLQSTEDPAPFGSNAWVIPGSMTKNGKPILSGDPHLQISVPNLWYRVQLRTGNALLSGAAIPGIPGIIIGTNGHVAWTFTNVDADTVDFVPLKDTKTRVRTDTIAVGFGKSVPYSVEETEWGPVLRSSKEAYAVQWVALDANNLAKLDILTLNSSESVTEALKALESWSGPVQNCFLADKLGSTAWAVVGRVPRRVGFDGRYSVERDANHRWNGYIETKELPRIVNPKNQVLFSGNQRTSPFGPELYKVSNNFPSPARGYRLKQIFSQPNTWDLQSSANTQLDTLSVVHVWYRDYLVTQLRKFQSEEWIKEILDLIEPWDGRLSVDSGAYLFLKNYRLALFSELLSPLLEKYSEEDKRIIVEAFKARDEWRVQILTHKPMNWLPSSYRSYDELNKRVAITVAKALAKNPKGMKKIRWGDVNHSLHKHPLSKIFPPFAFLLDFPELELGGDSLVLRVERPKHSASLRMTVDLANPENSVYSQAGGQSGHPLSKNYKDQLPIWYKGGFTSLYPGTDVSRITLTP